MVWLAAARNDLVRRSAGSVCASVALVAIPRCEFKSQLCTANETYQSFESVRFARKIYGLKSTLTEKHTCDPHQHAMAWKSHSHRLEITLLVEARGAYNRTLQVAQGFLKM